MLYINKIKDMRVLVFLIALVCFSFNLFGQKANVAGKENDPKAKIILDNLKKQIDSYKTIEIKFELESEIPNQAVDIQNGTYIQDGKKYQVKLKEQEIFTDGKTSWVYLKSNNEVQINDASDDAGSAFLSPKQLMEIYNKGEYVYSILEERKIDKSIYTDIEFKPVSKKSEFAKIRLTIDKKANKLLSLRVFSKDGSRFTIKVSELLSNKKYDASFFSLNTKSLKGVHVEDLRMN